MNIFTPYIIAIGLWLSGIVPLENFPPFVQQIIVRYQSEGAEFLIEDARSTSSKEQRASVTVKERR